MRSRDKTRYHLFPSSSDLPLHHRSHRFLSTDITRRHPLPSFSFFSAPVPPPHLSLHHHLLFPFTSLSLFLPRLFVPAASFLPLPSQRGRGRNILDVPRGIEGGYLHTNDNWWVSVSRFGREVSPGPPTRRSETTTTTTRRPLAVTHRVLPSSGVPTYSGYQRTDRPNEASVDAAHPNGPDLSARKTHAQHLLTLSRATESRLNNAFTVGGVTQSRRVFASFVLRLLSETLLQLYLQRKSITARGQTFY